MQILRASNAEMKSCTLTTSGGIVNAMQVVAGINYIDDHGAIVTTVDTVVFDWATGDPTMKAQIQGLVDTIGAQIAATYFT